MCGRDTATKSKGRAGSPFNQSPPALWFRMKLTLTRTSFGSEATLGDLDIDGTWFCHTLEDEVRELGPGGQGKLFGKTAIPAGTYRIDVTFSPKFSRLMVAVEDVPFFTGIRVHSGNTAEETMGCILVGHTIYGDNRITGGSEVMPRLYQLIRAALDEGEAISITIQNAPQAAA